MSSSSSPKHSVLLKVVILGDGGIGKSCLMNRFVSNHFDEQSFHTIGVEFLNKDVEMDGETYTLQIWDTAGQERFKTLRTPFYRGSDICLLTYAIDDQTSFRNLTMWKNEFLYYADIKDDYKFPFIVIGNKSDIDENAREVSELEMLTWCNESAIACCIETSARTAHNVQEAFKLAVHQWIEMEERHAAAAATTTDQCVCNDKVDLTRVASSNATRNSSCCYQH